ncbi:YncE family protein [Alloiococcus sp. CFN-8]|uniref:YncE family protein n=1 Tax=Alloiococcus sp. CFN-8 TaxID=3416081 RepID=UPI003CF8BB43
MDKLYICNTGSDYITELNLNSYKESKINFTSYNEKIGPYSLDCYGDFLVIINKYNSSLVKVHKSNHQYREYYDIGAQPNDIKVYGDKAYILCGEGNSLVIFDLKNNRIEECIYSGVYPHRIDICTEKGLGIITNMLGNNILLINCNDNSIIREIKVKHYPTKAIFIDKGENVLVCESYMGADRPGIIKKISLNTGMILQELYTGNYPADIVWDSSEDEAYVANFNDGSISIVDVGNMREKERIFIKGTPMAILKNNKELYIGDSHSNSLLLYSLYNKKTKIIPLGKEPNGMMLN